MTRTRSIALPTLLALFAAAACAPSPARPALNAPEPEAFERAQIVLERNVTDRDAEIVVIAKGGDEGLRRLRVLNPAGAVILDAVAGASTLGLREFAVESPEPGLEQVLRAYPEGVYVLEGTTLSGVRLESTAALSHRLPAPPHVRIDLEGKTVRWSPVAGAASYVLELEREVEDADVATLTLELPPTVTSIRIPAGFRSPGAYQAGVAVVMENGNITVVERAFSIGE